MLSLTQPETEKIVQCISGQLSQYADEYDEVKYPPRELNRLRAAFAMPDSVSDEDIEAALVWKYGKYSDMEKRNYPAKQKHLAARIAKLWPQHTIRPTQNPKDEFYKWHGILGKTSFVTICFLLHLAHPDQVPILDKNNFWSVNFHLSRVRHDFASKRKTPGQFEDLLLVRDFGVAVLGGWERYCNRPRPTPDILDRYLMMHGKSLRKARAS